MSTMRTRVRPVCRRSSLRTESARSGRPAWKSSRHFRPRAGISPRNSRGRECIPCRTGSGRHSAARSRYSCRDGCLDAELAQPLGDLRLQHVAKVHFRERTCPCASRSTLLQIRQVAFRNVEHHAFGDNRHAIAPPVGQPLDDARRQRVDDVLQPDGRDRTLRQ